MAKQFVDDSWCSDYCWKVMFDRVGQRRVWLVVPGVNDGDSKIQAAYDHADFDIGRWRSL
jgi:hypothetical protein